MSTVMTSDKLRSLRVLIVDDNLGDRLLYKQMLWESDPTTDYLFKEVESGRAATEIVHNGDLDCILLDYLLPDMVGLGVLKAWSEQQANSMPPIIMLTGFGDEATAVSALQSGAHGYISKRDLCGEKLRKAINHAIKTHKEQRLLEQSRQDLTGKNRELESKYQQIEDFYQQMLGKLKKPVSALRIQVSELINSSSILSIFEMQQQLGRLNVESERLVTTLKNLTDSQGIEVGQLLISTRPEPLMEVLSTVVSSFSPAANAKRVQLAVKINPGLPEVHIDRYRIEQVLSNLLDNAIRFSPAQGKVILSADCLPETLGFVTVSVTDSGAGIPPEELESLFDARSRSNAAPSGEEQGLGLGLKVCREIIRSHKGDIFARNLPDSGACVTFTLPLELRSPAASKSWNHVKSIQPPSHWGLQA